MAASDNVVRAGCTPKFKDIETLTSMLTYQTGYPEIYGSTNLVENEEVVVNILN